MSIRLNSSARGVLTTLSLAAIMGLGACADSSPLESLAPDGSERSLAAVPCAASVVTRTVTCGVIDLGGANGDVFGGQNSYVKLTHSNVSYNTGTQVFSFDVSIQNLMSEAIGTPDGSRLDPDGIRIFFTADPIATAGTGAISVANADGAGTFTAPAQSYFQYNAILARNEVSATKTWRLNVPSTVTTFAFTVYVETDVQPLLVINEVVANPKNPLSDANGEWIEIYNAGTRAVDMQGMVIADSAASGRRPYHLIASSLVVPAGGYVVLGNTTNTTTNGDVPVDYAYGSALALANSLDALKIARVVGTDTLTIDRTQYASAAVSAQDGISRELKNPALDNSNMDGSNWADADVTAVYGPGGRGTPKARNSTYTP